MQCSKCGSSVNDGARFCRECGCEIVLETEMPVGNICPRCNSVLKNGAMFCGKCGKPIIQNGSDIKSNAPEKDKVLICLIAVLVIVLFASVFAISYVCFSNYSIYTETQNIETSADNKDEVLERKAEDKAFEAVTKESEETEYSNIPEYTDDNFDVEDEVLKIRELYNRTQSNLSSLTKSTDERGTVRYYDADSEFVRMDIAADALTSYTKFFYFENGDLYFAFVFDGKKENRFYFKDNRLFRWIDESGKTHDKERSNGAFLEWEEILLNDLEV